MRDLGIYQYESYPIEQQSRGFTDRGQVDACLSYYRQLDSQGELKEYVLTAESDQCWQDNGVEHAALQALSRFKQQHNEPERQEFYVENSLINSVFGLFFWPVIFSEVPGALNQLLMESTAHG